MFLSRSTTAAVSIAVINSVGNLGGFVGPSLIGYVKGQTSNTTIALMFLSALLVISFVMTLLIRLQNRGEVAGLTEKQA
ncbi:hypothetical protein WH50_17130 [Pokkaliibacter plantistimulans]|uniref:Major facilitator superfamily (MFS) profile domain-containing protein n=1 Tax=Pokkaliibacter plantistimulans TaxID=1635171 RepID=A0ABX5LX51_9GAMM|nr:hypothetical protein WH50_17130 [Pokkaliibacter plantistimulans]